MAKVYTNYNQALSSNLYHLKFDSGEELFIAAGNLAEVVTIVSDTRELGAEIMDTIDSIKVIGTVYYPQERG